MLCTCEMLAFILLIFLENSDKFSFWYCLGNFSSVWHLCYVSMLTDHHSKVKFNFFLHCLKICAGLDPVFAITFKHISFCLHCCRCWENGTSLCIITKLLKWPVWNTIVIWCIYYRCELWLYCTISLWENRTSPLYSPWLPKWKSAWSVTWETMDSILQFFCRDLKKVLRSQLFSAIDVLWSRVHL